MAQEEKDLVGREREREVFASVLQDLAGGRGEVLFVAGEPGIGKTRLLLEFARLAGEAGIPVAWGRASEAGGAPALWPWQEILRELLRHHGRQAFVAAAGPGLPFIGRLLPEIGMSGAVSDIETSSARFQLFDAVTRLVCELAPLALMLDDLHAADLATLLLIEHAAHALGHSRVLLVGSFRPDDVEREPEVAKILWRSVRGATHLPLGRLSESEVSSLLEAVLGRPPSLEERRRVVLTTEGSPLFVREYARLLRARGDLPSSLPPVVRHALLARVERLPERTQAALATVSVLGRELDPRPVGALGVEAADLAPALQAGLLFEQPGGRWSFSHILLRDALYLRLGGEQRTALHERAGDALAGRPPAEIAHHRMLAGERIAEPDLVATVVAAATDLVRVLAFDDAAQLVQRALDARRLSERARGELLTQLGSARIRGGDIAEGRRACAEACQIARRLRDDGLFARAALFAGVDFTPGSVDPQLVALLEAAAALDLPDRALAARVRARLAAALQPDRDPRTPMRLAHEAIAMAREVGDPAVMIDVLAGATSALAYYEHPAVREPLDAELLALAERSGDRVLAFRALVRLVYDEADRGQRERAELHVDAGERLARALGQPRFVWFAKLVRASLAAAGGDFELADRLEAEGAALAGDDAYWLRCRLLYRFGRALVEARSEELADLEARFARLFDSDWFVWREIVICISAQIRARLGDRPGTRAALARLPQDSWAERHEMVCMSLLAEPLLLVGDHARARKLYANLRPFADWHIT
jgi:hypothetical protein